MRDDLDVLRVDLQQIHTIFPFFGRSAPARCSRPAVDDRDIAAVAMVRPHLRRARHKSPMQMTTENQVHSQLPKAVQEGAITRERRVRPTIRRRRQRVVRHYDTDIRVKCFVKDVCQELELVVPDPSVDDRPVGIYRIQRNEDRSTNPGHSIEFLRDERVVVPKRSNQTLTDPVERDVVVPRGDDDRDTSELLEVGLGLLELRYLRPLREVPGQDDHIGGGLVHHLQEGCGYKRPMGSAKMYVRPV